MHSFVLMMPAVRGLSAPELPWPTPITDRKAARWVRLDTHCHGDGQMMECDLYALVTGDDSRTPEHVIEAFRDWSVRSLEAHEGEAILLVRRGGSDSVESYSSRDGAPRLLGAVRSGGKGGLLS